MAKKQAAQPAPKSDYEKRLESKYKLGNIEPQDAEIISEVMSSQWSSPSGWDEQKAKLLEPIDHKVESREALRELIYLMVANGSTFSGTALELGISAQTVSKYCNTDLGKARIGYHQGRMFGKQTRKKVESLAEKAAENMKAFLDSANEKIQYNSTVYVLDQAMGKAKQSIEVQGNMLSEFMDRINSTREVKELGKDLQKPADDLDTFVNDIVKEHTVGVRNRAAKGTEEP